MAELDKETGRNALIARYATAAVNLYGVITIGEFVDVFNRYEDLHTTSVEVRSALAAIPTGDIPYFTWNDYISSPFFDPRTDDYREDVDSVRAMQRGKPRYLPPREEFLRYVDRGYVEPRESYANLRAHMLRSVIPPEGEGLDNVDKDIWVLREMIRLGMHLSSEMEYLTDRGYQFSGMGGAQAFVEIFMDVHNNTRLYGHNGFTADEIFEKFERPGLSPLPKEPFVLGTKPKVKKRKVARKKRPR